MSSAGHVIQVPILEKGDRLIIVEAPKDLPLQLLVSYNDPIEDSAKSVRYVLVDGMPDDLKLAVLGYLQSKTS